MSIGRTFKEALQKGLRSLEIGFTGLDDLKHPCNDEELKNKLRIPNASRILYIKEAIKRGHTIDQINKMTRIDLWFLENIKEIVELEGKIKSELKLNQEKSSVDLLKKTKEFGFSDKQLARLLNQSEEVISKWRIGLGIKPEYKLVDTCAAEFEAFTPYFYSTYES